CALATARITEAMTGHIFIACHREWFGCYCLASGIFSTARQAGGNCAMVIGGFGFGGSFGGFGCSVESLNQKARSPVEQPSLVSGSGWGSHSPEPGGALLRVWEWVE